MGSDGYRKQEVFEAGDEVWLSIYRPNNIVRRERGEIVAITRQGYVVSDGKRRFVLEESELERARV